MKIAGIIKNSFVDYPGQIAAVVFTQGCNYDCFFCHNRDLIPFEGEGYDEEEFFSFLQKRKGLLDGVVITGGEPALQKDLIEFSRKVKEMGYLLKLDTNGSVPSVVDELLKENLLDYVAMDYKAPFERYDDICCAKCDTDAVKTTLDIIRKSGVLYELRTTFIPQLSAEDIEEMFNDIGRIKTFALQHYKLPEKYKQEHSFYVKSKMNSEEEFKNAIKIAENYAEKTVLR